MSGRLQRCVKVFGKSTIMCAFFAAYVCLIVFSALTVQKHRQLDGNKQCNLSPKLFGGLFAAVYVAIPIQIIIEAPRYLGDIRGMTKEQEIEDNAMRTFYSLIVGAVHAVFGGLLVKYTIFLPCFNSQYSGTYVLNVLYAMFSLSGFMSIFTIIAAIKIHNYCCDKNYCLCIWMCILHIWMSLQILHKQRHQTYRKNCQNAMQHMDNMFVHFRWLCCSIC